MLASCTDLFWAFHHKTHGGHAVGHAVIAGLHEVNVNVVPQMRQQPCDHVSIAYGNHQSYVNTSLTVRNASTYLGST
jgi:hypothetical protein